MLGLGKIDSRLIFVVGSVRSGTSIIGQCLDTVLATGTGYFEGNVIGLTTAIDDAVGKYYTHFDEDYLRAKNHHQIAAVDREWITWTLQRSVLSEILRPLLAAERPAVWVDKSPDGHDLAEGVRACPLVARALPEARFVFCRRHGVENVESRMRKWPQSSFIDQCLGWTGVMQAWSGVREQLAGRFVEIDQFDIATAPAEVGETVGGFLGLGARRTRAIGRYLSEQRTEQTGGSTLRPLLDAVSWRLPEKWIFLLLCGQQMADFGYDFGGLPPSPSGHPTIHLDCGLPVETQNIDPGWVLQALPGGFQLHPRTHDLAPPLVRFRDIEVHGRRSRLTGMLVHGHREGPGIIYSLRILGARSVPLLAREYTVAGGEALEIDETFETDGASVTLEISTRLTRWRIYDTNAWSRIGGLCIAPSAG